MDKAPEREDVPTPEELPVLHSHTLQASRSSKQCATSGGSCRTGGLLMTATGNENQLVFFTAAGQTPALATDWTCVGQDQSSLGALFALTGETTRAVALA